MDDQAGNDDAAQTVDFERMVAERNYYLNLQMETARLLGETQQRLADVLKGRLLVPLVDVQRNLCRMSTQVTVDLPYADFDLCDDRQEFRRRVSTVINRIGDTFMKAWEQQHEKREDEDEAE